ISFSVPRCRRPICGSTRSTTSPSSSRTSRSTPWAAGCCGPKLMVKLRSAVSAMVLARHGQCRGLLGNLGVEAVPDHDGALVPALADEVDAVMGADAKRCLATFHLRAFRIDGHGEARRGRGQVADVDVDAEAA